VHQSFTIRLCRSVLTHTHPFNSPFSGTTQVSQYQKGKTNLDFTEARDSETILLCRSVNKAKPPNVLSCKVSCVRTEIFVGSMLEVQYVTW